MCDTPSGTPNLLDRLLTYFKYLCHFVFDVFGVVTVPHGLLHITQLNAFTEFEPMWRYLMDYQLELGRWSVTNG